MYSLVLMAAMGSAPTTPEFNGYFRDLFNGCSGCNGCSGGAARYSCNGGCSGSSYSCNGCCGGTSFLGFRDWVSSWSLWNMNGGCCGGCCGGFAHSSGCSGFSYGCSGSMAYPGGFGMVESYTPVFNGGLSCCGGLPMSAPAPVFEPYPAYPGIAVPAPATIPGTAVPGPPPSIPYAPPEAAPSPMILAPERSSGLRPAGFGATFTSQGGTGTRATVIVRLPADAKLYADGTALRMTGSERKFVTPELPGGMEYTYRFTAEYERNGEVVSVTKKVAVRPGGSAAVEFADLTATRPVPAGEKDAPAVKGDAVAAAPVSLPKVPAPGSAIPVVNAAGSPGSPPGERATITVTLPPGAALYVDNRKSPGTDATRRFATPPLPAGREFGYLLKAEVTRNGQPETLTQRVVFRSGEQVTVDLSSLGTGR